MEIPARERTSRRVLRVQEPMASSTAAMAQSPQGMGILEPPGTGGCGFRWEAIICMYNAVRMGERIIWRRRRSPHGEKKTLIVAPNVRELDCILDVLDVIYSCLHPSCALSIRNICSILYTRGKARLIRGIANQVSPPIWETSVQTAFIQPSDRTSSPTRPNLPTNHPSRISTSPSSSPASRLAARTAWNPVRIPVSPHEGLSRFGSP
jgi:hypothetical protein